MFHLTHILFSTLARPTAYLDPGSGSFLLQLLIAAILGGAIAFRSYFGRLLNFITGKKNEPKDEDDDD